MEPSKAGSFLSQHHPRIIAGMHAATSASFNFKDFSYYPDNDRITGIIVDNKGKTHKVGFFGKSFKDTETLQNQINLRLAQIFYNTNFASQPNPNFVFQINLPTYERIDLAIYPNDSEVHTWIKFATDSTIYDFAKGILNLPAIEKHVIEALKECNKITSQEIEKLKASVPLQMPFIQLS